jgi:hypothetical protein
MAGERSSGGNFYDYQFDSRIGDIRSNNPPPPEPPRSGFGWGRGGAVGGSGLLGLVLLRLCVAGCITANNAAYQSQYYGQQSGSSSAYADPSPWGQQQESADPEKKERDAEFQRRQEEERRQELARRAAEHRDPVVEEPDPQKQGGTSKTQPEVIKRRSYPQPRPTVTPRP